MRTQERERGRGNLFWYGVEGGAREVRRIVAEGWPDGVQRTLAALHGLEVRRAMSIRRKRTRGPIGDEIDMQRVYRGDLANAWEHRQRREAAGNPVQTLYVDIAANHGTSSGTLFWRGAAALVVADALTAAGYAVEIVAGVGCASVSDTRPKLELWHTITVKASNAPLDLNALAATLCLSGYWRVFGFAGICSIEDRVQIHLGRPRTFPYPNAIEGLERCSSAARAQAWIDATLAPFAG